MRRAGVPVLVAGVATVAACSIWAALDDPYKSDSPVVGDSGNLAQDAAAEAAADADSRDAARRTVDAGCKPYGIAAHGDTVYVVDPQGGVHAAYDASASFAPFWTGDGGDTFILQTNGIAATASGVFWTVSDGIHYCSVDGGGCGFLPVNNAPRAIAAGESAVAWIDSTGIRTCTSDLVGCVPASVPGSRGAVSVAVEPRGSIVWTDGGSAIQVEQGAVSRSVPVRYDVALVAVDEANGRVAWVGQVGLGSTPLDGGVGVDSPLTSMTKPIELFARAGIAYWSLQGSGIVLYCRYDSDAGCTPRQLVNGLAPPTTNDGIVATQYGVLAIVSSNLTSDLVLWP